ncbi:hypothetical protein SHIRM173S_06395 [Streptomyces hirsutus]
MIQLAALAIIGASGGPRVLLGLYIPLIVVAAALAALYMDNLATARNDTGAAKDAARDPHTWIMSFLYIGTFGSFIGYSFAFGMVLQNEFGRTPLQAAYVTFVGPLLGSLIRPVGGRLADRYGGSRITLWNFVGMGAATGVLIVASMQKSLVLFTVAFVVLFVLTGLGNGSTYKMIPGIFQAKALARGLSGEEAAAHGRRLSGASMGLIARRARSAASASTWPSVSPSSPTAPVPARSSPSWSSTRSAWRSPGPYTFAARRGRPPRRPSRRRSPGSAMPRCDVTLVHEAEPNLSRSVGRLGRHEDEPCLTQHTETQHTDSSAGRERDENHARRTAETRPAHGAAHGAGPRPPRGRSAGPTPRA